jgi:hypothetical protein
VWGGLHPCAAHTEECIEVSFSYPLTTPSRAGRVSTAFAAASSEVLALTQEGGRGQRV